MSIPLAAQEHELAPPDLAFVERAPPRVRLGLEALPFVDAHEHAHPRGRGEERDRLAFAPELSHGAPQIEVPREAGVGIGEEGLPRGEHGPDAEGNARIVVHAGEARGVAEAATARVTPSPAASQAVAASPLCSTRRLRRARAAPTTIAVAVSQRSQVEAGRKTTSAPDTLPQITKAPAPIISRR